MILPITHSEQVVLSHLGKNGAILGAAGQTIDHFSKRSPIQNRKLDFYQICCDKEEPVSGLLFSLMIRSLRNLSLKINHRAAYAGNRRSGRCGCEWKASEYEDDP